MNPETFQGSLRFGFEFGSEPPVKPVEEDTLSVKEVEQKGSAYLSEHNVEIGSFRPHMSKDGKLFSI